MKNFIFFSILTVPVLLFPMVAFADGGADPIPAIKKLPARNPNNLYEQNGNQPQPNAQNAEKTSEGQNLYEQPTESPTYDTESSVTPED